MNLTLITTMMSRTSIAAAFAFAFFALAPAAAQATDVRIVNYVSYTYSGASAVLTAEGVRNADAVRDPARHSGRAHHARRRRQGVRDRRAHRQLCVLYLFR